MKKYLIISVVVMAICAYAALVSADTIFNDMSKCIKCLGKESKCAPCKSGTAKPKAAKTKDVLGNAVPTQTDNSGKVNLVK